MVLGWMEGGAGGGRFCGIGSALMGGMSLGIQHAAIAMVRDHIREMEATTENLANANTPGYKRVGATPMNFSQSLQDQIGDNLSAKSQIFTDYEQGAIRETGRPLDFAVEGEGYFVLSDGNQEFYTRDGAFRLQSDGTIANSVGMKLQGVAGDLSLPPGSSAESLRIDENRNVEVDGKIIGQLKLITGTPSELQRVGNTLFTSDQPLDAEGDGMVLGRHLERSNANVMEEMVSMMSTLRTYESCQKMMKTADEIQGKMMDKLG